MGYVIWLSKKVKKILKILINRLKNGVLVCKNGLQDFL